MLCTMIFEAALGLRYTLEKGLLIKKSSNQKLNTKSSTEAELVGIDDMMTMILWN